MKLYVVTIFAACLCTAPVAAQDEDGPSMMEKGAQQFLEGLLKEIEPAWRELERFMDSMGPAMLELMEEVKDWSAYDPPEVLENGDIIIRRKPEADPTPPASDLSPQIEI